MAAVNLNHLHYFWAVARSGSVAAAAKRLHRTPQTVSGQLGALEKRIGRQLFRQAGRGLELTGAGRLALGYCDEIFALTDELGRALAEERPTRSLRAGISDAVPKSLAWRVLAPATTAEDPVRLLCREGKLDGLLAELALHRLDLVLADRPLPAHLRVRGHSHPLGDAPVAFFGLPGLVHGDFPAALNHAPMLLPGEDSALRPALEQWFEAQRLHPRVVGEFDDTALMKACGQAGGGVFPAPATLAAELGGLGCREIGRPDGIFTSLWAITGERNIAHAVVRAIIAATPPGLDDADAPT